VQDTGPGIPSDALERIFEPFVQSHPETSRATGGAGLGLAVCRELVRLQGGTIQASSVEGAGATFRFTLPIAATGQPSAPAEARTGSTPRQESAELALHRSAQPAGGARILVVDDEIVNLQVLVNQLGQAGHQVETCTSGQEAMDWMRTHARPDLILLDWMMPGMDGLEVCEQIRQVHPAGLLPIILVTARSQPADLVAGLRAGANDYVTKPFSGVELVARIAAHLRLAQTHRAVERFVPHPFLRLLGRDSIVDLHLGDSVAQEMVVLQCSLWGFTELAERLGPQASFRFVNEYLSMAAPPVGQHGGFVDKFIGDEMLALFEGGADAAVRAAVAMQQAIGAWNERRIRAEQDPVRLGVGVHSGSLMLGTVGEANQMSATVISDTVNLTTRLQELSSRYGAGVLVSGVVVANLVDPEAYRLRLLDELRVPGRPAALQVFEVFDADPPAVRAAKEATRRSFEAAVGHFHARAFSEAARLFRLCLAMDPVDAATRQYLDRCQTIQRQLSGDPGW
jgi:two-component system sensor histidine kinase ChiS